MARTAARIGLSPPPLVRAGVCTAPHCGGWAAPTSMRHRSTQPRESQQREHPATPANASRAPWMSSVRELLCKLAHSVHGVVFSPSMPARFQSSPATELSNPVLDSCANPCETPQQFVVLPASRPGRWRITLWLQRKSFNRDRALLRAPPNSSQNRFHPLQSKQYTLVHRDKGNNSRCPIGPRLFVHSQQSNKHLAPSLFRGRTFYYSQSVPCNPIRRGCPFRADPIHCARLLADFLLSSAKIRSVVGTTDVAGPLQSPFD